MKTDRLIVCHHVADEHSRLVKRITSLNLYSSPLSEETGAAPAGPKVFVEHLELLRDNWDETYKKVSTILAAWLDSFEVSDSDYTFTFKPGCTPLSADSLIREYAQASMTFGVLGSPRGDVYLNCMKEARVALRNELCASEMRYV